MKKHIIILISFLCMVSLSGCGLSPNKMTIEKPIVNTTDVSNSKVASKKKLSDVEKESIATQVDLAFNKFLSLLNKKDKMESMNMLDPYRKDYEEKRVMFGLLFDGYDINYSVVNKNTITIINDNKIILHSTILIKNDPRNTTQKVVTDDITMENIKGNWKIHSEKFYN